MTMCGDKKLPNSRNTGGGSKLRRVPQAKGRPELSLDTTPHNIDKDQRGSDPYNTSGSFDRKQNWARVGKR